MTAKMDFQSKVGFQNITITFYSLETLNNNNKTWLNILTTIITTIHTKSHMIPFNCGKWDMMQVYKLTHKHVILYYKNT